MLRVSPITTCPFSADTNAAPAGPGTEASITAKAHSRRFGRSIREWKRSVSVSETASGCLVNSLCCSLERRLVYTPMSLAPPASAGVFVWHPQTAPHGRRRVPSARLGCGVTHQPVLSGRQGGPGAASGHPTISASVCVYLGDVLGDETSLFQKTSTSSAAADAAAHRGFNYEFAELIVEYGDRRISEIKQAGNPAWCIDARCCQSLAGACSL